MNDFINGIARKLDLALESNGIHAFDPAQVWLAAAIIAAIVDPERTHDNAPTEAEMARVRALYGDD